MSLLRRIERLEKPEEVNYDRPSLWLTRAQLPEWIVHYVMGELERRAPGVWPWLIRWPPQDGAVRARNVLRGLVVRVPPPPGGWPKTEPGHDITAVWWRPTLGQDLVAVHPGASHGGPDLGRNR